MRQLIWQQCLQFDEPAHVRCSFSSVSSSLVQLAEARVEVLLLSPSSVLLVSVSSNTSELMVKAAMTQKQKSSSAADPDSLRCAHQPSGRIFFFSSSYVKLN